METVSEREAGGKHRQADEAARPPAPVEGRDELDDLPTETLPRAVDPAEPRTEVIDSEAVQAGPDGAPREDAEPERTPPVDRQEPAGSDETVGAAPAAEAEGKAAGPEDEPPAEEPLPAAAPAAAGAEPAAAAADTPPPALPVPPPARRGRRGGRIAAGVVALVVIGLVAWLVVTLIRAAGEPPVAGDVGPVTAAPAGFGVEVAGPDGWAVAIALPEAADRTGELPGDAARAVRLEVTLTNDADAPRDSAGWTVKAVADGRAVELLPTDGRETTEVPSRTVLPGSALRFAVEVPMPADEAELQLEAALPGAPPVLFVGRA